MDPERPLRDVHLPLPRVDAPRQHLNCGQSAPALRASADAGRRAAGDSQGNALIGHSSRRSVLDSARRGRSFRALQRPGLRGHRSRAPASAAMRPLPRGARRRVRRRPLHDRDRALAGCRRGEPRRGRHRRRREPPRSAGCACSATRSAAGAADRSPISARRSAGRGGSPSDPRVARRLLGLVATVPTPVWGRDELEAGEMWNSNSLIAWLLATAGLPTDDLRPPPRGRAPGWDAGLRGGSAQLGVSDRLPRAPSVRSAHVGGPPSRDPSQPPVQLAAAPPCWCQPRHPLHRKPGAGRGGIGRIGRRHRDRGERRSGRGSWPGRSRPRGPVSTVVRHRRHTAVVGRRRGAGRGAGRRHRGRHADRARGTWRPRARLGGAPRTPATIRVLAWGAVAMAVTAGVGALAGTVA